MGKSVGETAEIERSDVGGGQGMGSLIDPWDESELIQVRGNGALTYDGLAVGEFDAVEKRLILNLGWMRMAGLKLTVEGDPKSDKRRIVLARPTEIKRMEGGDQESLPL